MKFDKILLHWLQFDYNYRILEFRQNLKGDIDYSFIFISSNVDTGYELVTPAELEAGEQDVDDEQERNTDSIITCINHI